MADRVAGFFPLVAWKEGDWTCRTGIYDVSFCVSACREGRLLSGWGCVPWYQGLLKREEMR